LATNINLSIEGLADNPVNSSDLQKSYRALSQIVEATASAGIVTLRARSPGASGNVSLAKSGSAIAVSAATLTGGALGSTVISVSF
jgi:hypothetical protein